MLLRYIGGWSEAGLPGVSGSAVPGGTLEVEDEDRAAMAVAQGDWEVVGSEPAPKRKPREIPVRKG